MKSLSHAFSVICTHELLITKEKGEEGWGRDREERLGRRMRRGWGGGKGGRGRDKEDREKGVLTHFVHEFFHSLAGGVAHMPLPLHHLHLILHLHGAQRAHGSPLGTVAELEVPGGTQVHETPSNLHLQRS